VYKSISFHIRVCCRSNKTRAPIANLPNIAQLEGTPGIPPSYIQVCAVVWEYCEGQTDTQMAEATVHFASLWLTRNVTIIQYFYGAYTVWRYRAAIQMDCCAGLLSTVRRRCR